MVSIEIGKLSGTALDWAVAKCLGVKVYNCNPKHLSPWLVIEGKYIRGEPCTWSPSTRWDQCGELIDKFDLKHISIQGTQQQTMLTICREVLIKSYENYYVEVPSEFIVNKENK